MTTGTVTRQECIADGIFRLVLSVPFADQCRAGQFVSLYSNDSSRLLPRPISICEFARGAITLIYRIAGAGTEEFSGLKRGDAVRVLGPLGNGFPMEETFGKRLLLIGGGIGIPPLIAAASAARGKAEEVMFAAGYRSELYLAEEMRNLGRLLIATEDGSAGEKGTVLDAVRSVGKDAEADLIFACGPKPMLRAVAEYAKEKEIPCYVSMEERMACGIGACLGCVCQTRETDGHSFVKNARVCCDGPVFPAEEVIL